MGLARRRGRLVGCAPTTSEPTLPLTGGCTCGAVRFEIAEPLLGAMLCHCNRNPENPDAPGVRMGAFDEDPGIRPMLHQFTDYAVAWLPLPDDGLPRFAERIPAYEPPAD